MPKIPNKTPPTPLSLRDRLKLNRPTVPEHPHFIVRAGAGCGKTTTLVEGLKHLRGLPVSIEPSEDQAEIWEAIKLSEGAKSIGFAAFNVTIVSELERRLAGLDCRVQTLHSLGFKLCREGLGLGADAVDVDRLDTIIPSVMKTNIHYLKKTRPDFYDSLKQIIDLCKLTLIDTPSMEVLNDLTSTYDIDVESIYELADIVPEVLGRCLDVRRDRKIDQTDMIWLPVMKQLVYPTFDLLMVDELQDLNRCQQALVTGVAKRIGGVGDPRQAIYAFAGADSQSMSRLIDTLSVTKRGLQIHSLMETRRCSQAVVAEANKIEPKLKAHPDNPVGSVGYMRIENYLSTIRPGDAILCRCNAPLISECFKLLKMGYPAVILGKDVQNGLISTIKRMDCYLAEGETALAAVLAKQIDNWGYREILKEERKPKPSEARIIGIADRVSCLRMFCEGSHYVSAVLTKINNVFDQQRAGVLPITLASLHKSKGLEFDRVYFLMPEEAQCPHPMAQTEVQLEQEWNLKFVGITRTITDLYYVTD